MADRNFWPFSRLLITVAVLALAGQWFLGWEIEAQRIVSVSGQMFGVLSIPAMISFVLADLYLLSLLLPLLALGVVNDWLYAVLCGAPHKGRLCCGRAYVALLRTWM